MKKFAPTLIVAGMFAVSSVSAVAGPYDRWDASRVTDIEIADSFNRSTSSEYTSQYSEDNDVAVDVRTSEDNDVTSHYSEDNDVSSSYRSSEDNDVSSWYASSEDNDTSSWYAHSEDNDYAHSEDNDTTITEDNDITRTWDLDSDFQIATPTLTQHKYQDQQAGHQAGQTVVGAARGHEVDVAGGPTVVSAGNDEQTFFGPAMVNNNTNQLPQNNLFVQGSNGAPISQSNTFAGRDMGPKGVFAPVGNTSATVFGDTLQSSQGQLGQSGDSSNSIADQMNSGITR